MTVLVIAYYFPPLGLSGVQRITKFLKYLPQHGWNPIVVTPKPSGYFAYDEELEEDLADERIRVVRTSSVDPTRLTGKKEVRYPKEKNRKKLASLSQFVFVPDNKIGWYPMAIKGASEILKREQVDAILSTAPPYSGHLIAARLARKFDKPLIADFRDDWYGNPRHEYPTRVHSRLQKRMESYVVKACSAVTSVNSYIADSIERRHPKLVGDVVVLPQGYDPDDLSDSSKDRSKDRPCCQFFYAGVFYDAQKPDTFLKAAKLWVDRNPQHADKIRLTFAGLLPSSAIDLANKLGIASLVEYLGYLSHPEVCDRLMEADVLWMTIGDRDGSERVASGKLYEYFGTRKPILGLVPEGGPHDDLKRYSAGHICHPDDIRSIAEALDKYYRLWESGNLPVGSIDEVQMYDRRELTAKLASILSDSVRQHTHQD